ncbi:MAG: hypothetical protein F6K41_39905 [Symploca sp. SIO3E6]|nr:hypothetical protein [Caldora sp. SIO3E6]
MRNFNFKSHSQSSLSSWAYHQTKKNPEIKNFFLQAGVLLSSDWAILNRDNSRMLALLKIPNAHALVAVFHAVYRRDRRQQRFHRTNICPEPTNSQLGEMLGLLQERGIMINCPRDLMVRLRKIATLLRDYEIWGKSGSPPTESMEISNPSTGETFSREFLDPRSSNDLEQIEEQKLQELQEFCEQQLIACLEQSIEEAIDERLTTVRQSRRNGYLASQVKPGLQLLYCQGMSQREIAAQLSRNNTNKVSRTQIGRLLRPQELLSTVRFNTVNKLLERILAKANSLSLTIIESPTPDYLDNLKQQLEAFTDQRVFREAAAELQAGRYRSLNSLYAQKICSSSSRQGG